MVGFHIETPDQQRQDENRSLLISAYGEKWKGCLYAEWNDEKPDWLPHHGMIMPEVNIPIDDLEFDEFDPFEKRFYEVLEQLKALDIVAGASLKVNGRQIFKWQI